MQTNRQQLIDILTAVKPGLANKEILEQSTSFIFAAGKVLTYNDEVSVQHPLPDSLRLEGAVAAKELFALLNKLPDEEIDLETTENELVVKGKKTKAGIRLQVATTVEETLRVLGDPQDWIPLPEKFLEAIGFCLFSTGRDMTKPMLTCVCVDGGDVVSSDDRRITRFMFPAESSIQMMLIPATSAKALQAYPVTEYALTKGWLHFRTEDDVVFSCRGVEGQYPVDKIITILDRADGESVKLPTGLAETLERAGVFSTGASKIDVGNRVKLSLTEGQLVVRGESEAGWLEEINRVRYKGPDIEFEVSADFLQAILAHSGDMVVGENLLKFAGDDFVHVVSVMGRK